MSTSSTITSLPPAASVCPAWCFEHSEADASEGETYGFHYSDWMQAEGGTVRVRLDMPYSFKPEDPESGVVMLELRAAEGSIDLRPAEVTQAIAALTSAHDLSAGPRLRGERRMVAETTQGDDGPLLLTIAAAAERLSIKPWALLKLADGGVIRTVYLGRRLVVAESLREYVASLNKARA